MATLSVEERLSAVENELQQLKMQLQAGQTPQTETPWWLQRFGAFKDDPDYDSAMERGAAYRRAQPKADEAGGNMLA